MFSPSTISEESEMTDIIRLSWADIEHAAEQLAYRTRRAGFDSVWGIAQGGWPVALIVSRMLNIPVVDEPGSDTLIVDDLVDTGTTASRYFREFAFDALFRKPSSPDHLAPLAVELDGWLAFPWERDEGEPTDAIIRLLQHIGEDPNRDGLIDTPKRVVKSLSELTNGYDLDPAEILSTTFDVTCDEMICVRKIPFSSLCEHHMLPFHGTATLAYIPAPGGRVVGLSKLARLVDCFARRLQVQERMTSQIAEAIEEHLQPLGVGVIISASHTCMSMRGIAKPGEMVTSKLIGALRTESAARAEFMGLADL
jgi:GTP cyclohydrolase I